MKNIIRKFKNLFLWLLLGLILSWVWSCTPTPSNSNSQKQEVEFWTMQLQPKFTPYFNNVISDFESTHADVKLRWVDVPWTAMESKILTAVSANTAPDLVNLNPNFASQLASRDSLLTLNTRIKSEIKQEYLPKIWEASSIDGQTFGIPWYLTTRVTLYNQDLLNQAGIKEPPQTYEDLAKTAKIIKEKTGKYAFFIPFVAGDSAEVLESLVQMGVTLVDAQGKAAFNTPEGKAAFSYWVNLYQQKLLPPEVLTQGHQQAIQLYQGGETVFLASSAEFLNAIATNAPTIAEKTFASSQITGKTGKKNVAVMNWVIPKNTKMPDQALEFALFVTNTENQLAFAKEANVLPSTQKAIAQYIQELEQTQNLTSVEQARKVSALQLADAEVLVPAMKDLNLLQKAIYENLQQAMLGEKTVDQALSDAATAWDNRES
jgi:putative chitobiose transport system substrate-binding protein